MNRVVFLGSKDMGLRCLTAMYDARPESVVAIVTIDDRSDTRHAFVPLHEFGAARGIPVAVTRSRADVHEAIHAAHPDLVIVCGWYSMLAAETLTLARRGFVGVHNSLLPQYRGAAPIVWAMLNGETHVGLSMYTLANGMDDGDVWAQTSTWVGPDDYIGAVLSRLEDACEEMVRAVFPRILDGTIAPKPQDHGAASYGAVRRPEDGRIDWTRSADYVYRFIRAQSVPYPGAFTCFEGGHLTIWKASMFPSLYFAEAGEIVRGPAGEVVVVCGDSRALVLTHVELAGAAPIRPQDLVRPTRTRLGS